MAGTRRKAGALASQVEGCRSWLTEWGYTELTVRNMLKDLGKVGTWLSGRGLQVSDLDEERLGRFLSDQREAGRRRLPGPRGMKPLLSYLREAGLVQWPKTEVTPLDAILEDFGKWMAGERGLSATTIPRYTKTARRGGPRTGRSGGGWWTRSRR